MKKFFTGVLILFTIGLNSCGTGEIPDPNPGGFTGLDFTINISQSPYTTLQVAGGSAIVTDKKVIVARLDNANWAAVQSYCPNDNTTNLTYSASDKTFRCSKDGSVFNFDGSVKSGNSEKLKRFNYTFNVNNNNLRIFE